MAKKPKHFTINIATLVENINVSTTNLKEGAEEIKKQVTDALTSAVNDSQIILDDSKVTPTENGSSRSQSETQEKVDTEEEKSNSISTYEYEIDIKLKSPCINTMLINYCEGMKKSLKKTIKTLKKDLRKEELDMLEKQTSQVIRDAVNDSKVIID